MAALRMDPGGSQERHADQQEHRELVLPVRRLRREVTQQHGEGQHAGGKNKGDRRKNDDRPVDVVEKPHAETCCDSFRNSALLADLSAYSFQQVVLATAFHLSTSAWSMA